MNSILKYWFGFDQTTEELNQATYRHLPMLWFKISNETDNQITRLFATTLNEAEQGLLEEWNDSVDGSIALIILYDQLAQCIHRGTPRMFQFNSKAVIIAIELIKNENEFAKISSIEKYFIYSALLNQEDLKTARIGLDGIKKVYEDTALLLKQKEVFLKYYNSAKKSFGVLAAYGRYPQRNDLLDRESTKEEIVFLKKYKNSFAKSTKKTELSIKNHKLNEVNSADKQTNKPKLPMQNVLFLHGFRQSANKIKKRLHYSLVKKLKIGANVHITFLNGTHPYKPNSSNDSTLNMIESQRAWYNLHDETEWDAIAESELNESLAHVFLSSKGADGRPIYDGIIGFSQGAVLASILIKKHPNLFKYFIAISGYQTTAPKHSSIYSQPIDKLPSLHIYGLNDKMVDPVRSEALSKWFLNNRVKTHTNGHFAPDSWPSDQIASFIAEQSAHIQPTLKSFSQIVSSSNTDLLRLNVHEVNFNLQRFDLDELDLEVMFESQQAISLFRLIKNNEQPFSKNTQLRDTLSQEIEKNFPLNDKLLLVYYLMLKNKSKQSKEFQNLDRDAEQDETVKSALFIWSQLYTKLVDENILNDSIEIMFIESAQWHELIYLCDLAYQLNLTNLYDLIIEKLTEQLITDLIFMDRKRNMHNFQALTSNSAEISLLAKKINAKLDESIKKDEEISLSRLSFYLPRVKSSLDKRSRIARTCARRLNHFSDDDENLKTKILSYNHFRKILSVLTHYIKSLASNAIDTNPRIFFNMARTKRSVLDALINSEVFSDAILNPVPEPVDVSSRNQMQPLYDWLKQSSMATMKLNENDLKFLKGTVTLDGRLDLCKQVIGPHGVEPLLESMQNSKYVDRLLLGNNIVGDEGAKLIADFISSGKSTIYIWYIAGNNITSIGLEKITKALQNDTKVSALWLKRNPLKSAGMIPLSELLFTNTSIQVLDLLNCGLLDSGASILFNGLKSNKHLKHLYLSANGITPVGLRSMLDYFETVENSELESLFLGCNRIGNEGAKIVGECLRYAPRLERLNLSSSRIGPIGMKYLCEHLNGNQSVKLLELGYMRATMDLGELNNFIEDEGVGYLTQLLASNSTKLTILDISHNLVSQIGFEMLVNMGVKENKSLVSLNCSQFGVHFREDLTDLLKYYLKRNRDSFLQSNSEHIIDEILLPQHVKEIYSVYRTH